MYSVGFLATSSGSVASLQHVCTKGSAHCSPLSFEEATVAKHLVG